MRSLRYIFVAASLFVVPACGAADTGGGQVSTTRASPATLAFNDSDGEQDIKTDEAPDFKVQAEEQLADEFERELDDEGDYDAIYERESELESEYYDE